MSNFTERFKSSRWIIFTSLLDDDDDKHAGGKKEDGLIQNYDTILRESALLTTFAGILFGFLLDISINLPESFAFIDRVVHLVALFSITFAASIFVMPVIIIYNIRTKTWQNLK